MRLIARDTGQPDATSAVRGIMRFLRPYLGSLGMALVALVLAIPINIILDVSTLSRLFLVAVLVSAVTYGLWPAMFAALISVVFYDFFFLPPVYSLAIHSTADLINLSLFVVTAAVISGLAARVRRYAIAADTRALTAEKLSAYSRCIGGALSINDVLARSGEQITAALDTPAAVMMADGDRLQPSTALDQAAGPEIRRFERLAKAWTIRRGRGLDAEAFQFDGWYFQGTRCNDELSCVVMARIKWPNPTLDAEEQRLLLAFAQLTASAIEQHRLRQQIADARLRAESQALGAALLDSITHDLNGPLTSILGATSALDQQWSLLRDDSKFQLIRTAREEAQHLSGYITNLLSISRFESGIFAPTLAAVMLDDLVGSAIYKARGALARHRVITNVSNELPLVQADAVLLEQAVVNILDNAAKYSPTGSQISVVAEVDGDLAELRVLDEGPGLPVDELERVFDKFYRSTSTSNGQLGTGLGLTICRGVVEAMHGTIQARNRTDRSGACFLITIPVALQAQLSCVE